MLLTAGATEGYGFDYTVTADPVPGGSLTITPIANDGNASTGVTLQPSTLTLTTANPRARGRVTFNSGYDIEASDSPMITLSITPNATAFELAGSVVIPVKDNDSTTQPIVTIARKSTQTGDVEEGDPVIYTSISESSTNWRNKCSSVII